MDVTALAGAMDQSRAATTISMGVLRDTESLAQDLVSRLFGSMGIGTSIDAYA
ncbi:MAG TPA: hypothetical protein VFH72_13030 [Candidatus Baltobacteraceae bacterium]|nr:hypothetical protein [Candidatus Baltobacteraceae bacterium]